MFKIVVGCYEQIVLGYNVTINKSKEENNVLSLQYEQKFSDHSHLGCVRCIASNHLLVVSGSTDESMSIFNMKTNSDLGPLQGHTGSVNEIVIPESLGNRILSCGDDGKICVWEAGKKKKGLIRMLQGHQGRIDSLAVHPTGKLAMSASKKDGSLRTWNLITGRSAYVKNTKRAQIEFVRWGPSGDYYVTASSRFVQIYNIATAKCVIEWETPRHILTIKFLPLIHSSKTEYIAIGDDTGHISIYSVPIGSMILRYKAHESRVKDIHGFIPSEIEDLPEDEVWLVSVCSDGKIKLWRFDHELLSGSEQELTDNCLLTIDSTARLTCVTVWQGAVSTPQNNESVADEENEVVKKIPSITGANERVEVTYDEGPDSETTGLESVKKERKPISNGKIKKKKGKPSSKDKNAKLKKLRAVLETTSTENEEASVTKKKKRKVKFSEDGSSEKVSKKVKSVEKTQERGRKRQRTIRDK